jgi:hypothetical protein
MVILIQTIKNVQLNHQVFLTLQGLDQRKDRGKIIHRRCW